MQPLYARGPWRASTSDRKRRSCGRPLPSEKQLEPQHGVSGITGQHALLELERESPRGRGRQASVVEPLVSAARHHIDNDLATMLDLIRSTELKLRFRWHLPDDSSNEFALSATTNSLNRSDIWHLSRPTSLWQLTSVVLRRSQVDG